jgi:hypothetical protein
VTPRRRAIRRFLATTIAACFALGVVMNFGCSFVFVRGPAKEVPGRYEPAGCTTSRLAPWIDVGVAAAQGYGIILYTLGQTDAQYAGMSLSREQTLWILIGTASLDVVSAMYGFATVATCREVQSHSVNPYHSAPVKQTRAERRADEAAEEAAVQARINEKAAADAKAAGEAAGATPAHPAAAPTPAR